MSLKNNPRYLSFVYNKIKKIIKNIYNTNFTNEDIRNILLTDRIHDNLGYSVGEYMKFRNYKKDRDKNRELIIKKKIEIEKLLNINLSKMKKIGVVITTHGYNGVFVKQCLDCYKRELPKNTYIVLYINESNDPIIDDIRKNYKGIDIIYINDQNKNGGLTATWNNGIDLCFKNKCETIILSNDDIIFDDSIKYIIKSANDSDKLEYFGPLTNEPGPAKGNQNQFGTSPLMKNNFVCRYNNKLWNINGFFMVFSKKVLLHNKFDKKHYFDPKYPFGGNETEWFNRFIKKGGMPIVVPRTFIYHYKLRSWRDKSNKNNKCIFTINTGNYEGNKILVKKYKNIDTLYFTDNKRLLTDIIDKGIIPMLVDSSKTCPKLLQRSIKTCPHKYLPHQYEKSLYIDGNHILKDINPIELINKLNQHDLICYAHPDRTRASEEANAVYKFKLETKNNINKILNMQKNDGFPDNIGLTETGVLIRNHKNIIDFSND